MSLQEVARREYGKGWGIMTHTGEIITGHDKPDALTHSDLNKKVPAKHRHKTVEFALADNGKDLMIRTASRDGVLNAMKNWRKLPPAETVSHDHCDNLDDIHVYGEGKEKPEHALLKMNRILKRY